LRRNANGRSPASDTAAERGDVAGLGADHDVRTQPIGERRARDREGCQRLRNQWPILAAGTLSTISGVGFAAVAVADDTVHLGMLALTPPPAACSSSSRRGCSPAVPPGAESSAAVPA
jgi:hypothetical protein